MATAFHFLRLNNFPSDACGFGDELDAGTDPTSNDTDDDGLSDDEELDVGTDPTVADTDSDGLDDGDEIDMGTDPLNPDSDGDGLTDGFEYDCGSDPDDPESICGDDSTENEVEPGDRIDDFELTEDVAGCGCSTVNPTITMAVLPAGLALMALFRRRND